MKNRLWVVFALAALLVSALVAAGCGGGKTAQRELKVYNAGDYIDPDLLKLFEKETGIRVIYDTWATNEDMYVKVKAGGSDYDLVIPSDYMIERMVREDMLEKIDMSRITNHRLIDERFKKLYYDPKNEYSVPYMWGTVGIIYNEKMVKEPVDSWGILWKPQYAKQIFMLDSLRDSIGVALKYGGYSLNAHDDMALAAARDSLIRQKPLVQAYVVDEVKDKMIAGEAALAVVWSGDAVFMMEKNPDLRYAIPQEGTNIWVDGMVILKGAKHKAEAEEFIDFLTRPDIAKQNVEYLGFASPISEVVRQLPLKVQQDIASYPPAAILEKAEFFYDLGDHLPKYDRVWTEVKVAQ